ncbi:putative transcription factor IIIB subunit BRF-1 [Cryptosporidium serpentis]
MKRICPQCSSLSIETHEGRGETICTNCGAVLEESTMVEGFQFSESSNGSIQMVGHFVPSSGVRGFALVYGNRESREHVLQRGYHNLQRIADQLHFPISHIESAQRVFLMAVQRNFTIGRNNMYVASACLYAICRREKTPHMLIDFSDVLQAPVKVLGQVFMKLLRLLRLHVPNIDPSMFMERFAAQMNLGNKTHSIAATGVRIVQALTRDWITTGRRPTGLCGAALLISARYHGIPVSSNEIAQIVRISSPTLLKRLAEFKHTSTAQLTAAEFENTDLLSLPVIRGPPCFERNKLKALQKEIQKKAITNGNNKKSSIIENIDLKSDNSYNDIDNNNNLTVISSTISSSNLLDNTEKDNNSLAFPKFMGGIELDITQDSLCNDEPTSQDITVIASKLINAIDKVVNIDQKNNNKEKYLNNEINNSEILNDDSENNFRLDPLKYLFNDLKNMSKNSVVDEYEESSYNIIINKDINLDNRKEDFDNQIEDLSDISDSEINDLLLDDDEKEAKSILWDEITRENLPYSWLRKINNQDTNIEDINISPVLDSQKVSHKKRRYEYKNQDITDTNNYNKDQKPETAVESILMALDKNNRGTNKYLNSDTLAKLFTIY